MRHFDLRHDVGENLSYFTRGEDQGLAEPFAVASPVEVDPAMEVQGATHKENGIVLADGRESMGQLLALTTERVPGGMGNVTRDETPA